jgi:hypothetical protein
VRDVLVGIVLALAITGCIVKHLVGGPRLTGTCDGACAHYVECKPAHQEADRARCATECPGVFSDRDSLMMYESLTCKDAVEYIDGTGTKSARTAP